MENNIKGSAKCPPEKLEHLRKIFSGDVYATATTGIVIDDAAKGYSRCSLEIGPHLLNANGFVMGGAIFTLADFAFAVASNFDGMTTVSVTSQISYLTVAKGTSLIAEAECIREGRNVCYYSVTINDDTGRKIAVVSITGFIS